jgi:hypothetical protein
MNLRVQRFCAWCGYAFLVALIIGFLIAGFVPPPSPAAGPDQIAEMFRDNTLRIRVGMCICIFAAPFLLLPWGGAVVTQMRRLEGPGGPLTYGWIMAQVLTIFVGTLSLLIWAVTAFRPEASPESFQRFNDFAWLCFLGIISMTVYQGFSLAFLILTDRRPRPVFPRWLGYFLIWDVIGMLPACLVIFFKNGPLAWNGVLAWWIPIVASLGFFAVTTPLLIKAINQPQDQIRSFQDDLTVSVTSSAGRDER